MTNEKKKEHFETIIKCAANKDHVNVSSLCTNMEIKELCFGVKCEDCPLGERNKERDIHDIIDEINRYLSNVNEENSESPDAKLYLEDNCDHCGRSISICNSTCSGALNHKRIQDLEHYEIKLKKHICNIIDVFNADKTLSTGELCVYFEDDCSCDCIDCNDCPLNNTKQESNAANIIKNLEKDIADEQMRSIEKEIKVEKTPIELIRELSDIINDLQEMLEKNILITKKIVDAISKDRCDGNSDYALGVNAACKKHMKMINNIIVKHS